MSRKFSAEVVSDVQIPAGNAYFMSEKAAQAPTPGRGFVGRETRRSLTAMQGGDFMLLPGIFSDVDLDDGAQAYVNLHDRMRFSRESSRNQVQFGQLVVHDVSSRERVEAVAVKPLDTPGRAAREFGAMSVVNEHAQRGRMPAAFTPIGFYRSPEDGRVAILTRYEHSVLTLDNLFWDPNSEPSESSVRKALGHCAISLGRMHSNGIAHSDAQVKNIGVDNLGARYVDLEGAQELINGRGVVDPFGARRLIEIDVRTCLESLNSQGLEYISDNFTPIYQGIVSNPGSAVPEEAVLSPGEISEMSCSFILCRSTKS